MCARCPHGENLSAKAQIEPGDFQFVRELNPASCNLAFHHDASILVPSKPVRYLTPVAEAADKAAAEDKEVAGSTHSEATAEPSIPRKPGCKAGPAYRATG